MRDDKTSVKNSSAKESGPVVENGKKKSKEERPATKVVVRRLPPSMTEEQFKMQVSPLPDIDYFYFVPADMSLSPNAFCRAYLNFVDQSDLFIFTQKFDGYVFLDSKGGEFPAVVEFAPFQRIPKNRPNRKKDPKVGTIEDDPVFISFKEQLEAENLENKAAANASKQHFFETSLLPEKKEVVSTPLLEYIRNKRAERQRIRDEKREEKRKKDLERRKAKEEQKKVKKDEDSSVVKRTESCFSKPPKPNPSHHSIDAVDIISDIRNDKGKYKTQLRDIDSDNKNDFSANKVSKGQEISTQVYELVHLLSTSGDGLSSTEKNGVNLSLKSWVRHSDIEKEMLRSVKSKSVMCLNKIKSCNKSASTINSPMFSFNKPTECFGEYRNVKFTSSFGLRDNMITHCTPRPFSSCTNESTKYNRLSLSKTNSDSKILSYKELQINLQKIPKHGNKTVPVSNYENKTKPEINTAYCSDNFSGEVFRKSLQKVVADVLGESKVKSPRKNIISKPKVFVKRCIIDGSGEQCTRGRFNSPSYYLPPRTFGFGPSQSMKETPSCQDYLSLVPPQRSPKIVPVRREYDPTFSRTLPPFRSKPIISSKSDGDIETSESSKKVGGSQESFKRRIAISACGIRPFGRRPYVAQNKSLYMNKNDNVFHSHCSDHK